MFTNDIKMRVLAVMAVATVLFCATATVVPQTDNINPPAVEATGVIG